MGETPRAGAPRPLIVVVSGPGGVGKGTVVRRLLERDPRLWLSRSWTTRAPRPGEAPDAYRFVTPEEFEEHARGGGFLEWAEFLGNRYGTPVPDAPPDRDVLLEIEVEGARQVKEQFPDALLIALDAPTRDEQAARLQGRGDTPEQVESRVAKAPEELRAARQLGARMVVNDELERTVDELERLIAEARIQRSAGPGR